MAEAHRRPKEPELVRAAVLDCARAIVVEGGIAGLSINAVAASAGVTKGAVFHHFGSKAALVEAVFAGLFEELDREIDASLADEGDSHGCFTRAYVATVFRADERHQMPPRAGLWISAIADPAIRPLWAGWMERRLERHRATDGAVSLALVRHAADGIWLADIVGVRTDDRAAFHERLMLMTRKDD